MDFIVNLIPFITGCYLVAFAFIIDTKNFASAMVFQVMPMFLGLGCLFSAGKLFGWF